MGDIADWTNAQMQEAYPDWCPVGSPRKSRQKPYRPITCRYCMSQAVVWLRRNDKWILVNQRTGEPHVCQSTDDFKPVLDE